MRRLAKLLLVRDGEGRLVVYLGALNLLVGLAMALGRTSGDALFLNRFGVEYLPQMFFATSVLLVFFSAVYATYADRVSHARLFKILFYVVAVVVALNWMGMNRSSAAWPYAVYFLSYAVASEIILIHVSLYVSGLLDASQEKRVLPLISAAARLGAVAGGVAIGLGASYWPLENMAIAWFLMLGLAALAVHVYHHGERTFPVKKRRRAPLADIKEGWRFAKRSAFLQIAGAGLFLLVILISLQEYVSSVILTNHFNDESALAVFFGWFFAATNFTVLLLQLIATNRLLQRFGLAVTSLVFPFSTLASFALLFVSPSFIPAIIARFNHTGMLHAFRNPAANLSYNALPGYIQGRARAFSIGIILPSGLAVAGGLLLVVQHFGLRSLAALGCVLAVLYLVLKVKKNRLYGEALIQLIQQQVFSRRATALDEAGRVDDAVVHAVMDKLERSNDAAAIEMGAGLFMQFAPHVAGTRILAALEKLPPPSRDRLLMRLAQQDISGWQEFARASLRQGDSHLRATALLLLDEKGDELARQQIPDWLDCDTPRLKATAAYAALERYPELRDLARATILKMLASAQHSDILAALPVAHLACASEDRPLMRAFLKNPVVEIRAAGVRAWSEYCSHAGVDCRLDLAQALSDDEALVREAAVSAAVHYGEPQWRLSAIDSVMDDPSHKVRKAANEHAQAAMPGALDGYAEVLKSFRCHFNTHRVICRCLAETDLTGKHELLAREGFEQIRLANEKRAARNRLTGHPLAADLELISIVLQEECRRHIGSTIEILRLLGESDTVRAIRAALASGDRRLRAQGIDSLRYLRNDALVGELMPLLDPSDALRAEGQVAEDNIETVLRACISSASPWLRQCIGQRLRPGEEG